LRYWSRLCRTIKEDKPILVDNIFIHSDNNRILYLNPNIPDWITINEVYKPIFDLFNGINDEKTIIKFIKKHFANEEKQLIMQIRKLINTSGIFTRNKNNYKNIKRKVKTLNSIYLTITDDCNLECKYCYAVERNKKENATLEKWIEYVSLLIKFAGKPVFTFTGGEPLIVPYIFELASFIKNKGCKTILLTNGTMINSTEIALKIKKHFDLIKISLDSLDEKINAHLRGIEVQEKVKKAFQLLSSSGCNVNILSTITSMNCDNLDEFSNYFNHQVNFQPLYTMGRANINNCLLISGEQYYNALTKTGKFNLLHYYHERIFNFKNDPNFRCSMAETELSINPNGDVFPCHMLHYDKYNCGNLNSVNIKDIYYNSNMLNEIRKINVDNIPQCKSCNYKYFCGGACRGRINITRDGLLGNDEFCVFEQNQILDALMYSYG